MLIYLIGLKTIFT